MPARGAPRSQILVWSAQACVRFESEKQSKLLHSKEDSLAEPHIQGAGSQSPGRECGYCQLLVNGHFVIIVYIS
jgi:hypothetical protein